MAIYGHAWPLIVISGHDLDLDLVSGRSPIMVIFMVMMYHNLFGVSWGEGQGDDGASAGFGSTNIANNAGGLDNNGGGDGDGNGSGNSAKYEQAMAALCSEIEHQMLGRMDPGLQQHLRALGVHAANARSIAAGTCGRRVGHPVVRRMSRSAAAPDLSPNYL